jgi:RND family efflux transporter MFP subunit
MPRRSFLAVLSLCALAGALGAGCGRGDATSAPGAGGPPPAAVQVAVLTPKVVEDATEFVATLRSRRSTEIRPQVEGPITRIFVKSGDRVGAGTPLAQIDPSRQSASASSSRAARMAQEASVRFARDQFARSKDLFAVGAISRQEYEQAEWAVRNAEATLESLKAQEQEEGVQLRYYRVSAPTAGVVGDIPVRVGDRVTTSTLLTTIDQNIGLEAYILVPVERAPLVRVGLPVVIVDDRGKELARTAVSFISPQVDDRTQTVLVKAQVQPDRGFRNEQFVRARVVWRAEPTLTVPAVAVARISGQHFAYVAEAAGKGQVARQRAVRLGQLTGNDYVVVEGLREGERLIVSGIQKLADGAPVDPKP